VLGRQGSRLRLLPAPVLRERHRRVDERVAIASAEARLVFAHPLGGPARVRRVVDVGAGGCGFLPEPRDVDVWSGLALERARLELPGCRIKLRDASVCAASDGRVGVRFGALAPQHAETLRSALVQLRFGQVKLHDGRDLKQIVEFHRSVQLMVPEMEKVLMSGFAETQQQWRRAHQGAGRLMKTAVVGWNGGIGATLTAVRAYDRGWLFQHMAVASPLVSDAGSLHEILMSLVAAREDGEYVSGFVHDAARSVTALMRAFFERTDLEHRGSSQFAIYSAPPLPPGGERFGRELELLGPADDDLVENAALRLLPAVSVRAMGLRRGEVAMPRTRAAYRRIGIERGREVWAARRDGQAAALLVREWGSSGLSLSGLLSMGMLLPVRPDLDVDGSLRERLCRQARALPVPSDPPFRFLFLPEGCDDSPLLRAGFVRLAGVTHFALHRLGFADYRRYAARRYGVVKARLRPAARAPRAA
jgi:hypothetical protein